MSESSANRVEAERRALILSSLGYLVFGSTGIVFFLLTRSEAILLDGVYSLISVALALLALRVSKLVEGPDSRRFHFGFGHFEPIINSFRVTLILGVDAFALFSAVETLISGGRPLATGLAVIYGGLSAVACLTMSVLQGRNAKRIHSAILRVDARNWFADGMISSGIGLAFLGGYLLEGTSRAAWINYIDPLVVIILVLGTLPLMLKSLRENVPQVLLHAPDPEQQAEVRRRVETVLMKFDHRNLSVRMIEMGRFFYTQIHVIVPEETTNLDVRECDRLRLEIEKTLGELYPRPVLDVIFTAGVEEGLVLDWENEDG